MSLKRFSTLVNQRNGRSVLYRITLAAACTSCACGEPLSVETRHHIDNRSEDQRQRLIEQQVSVGVEDDEFLLGGADPLEHLSCVPEAE